MDSGNLSEKELLSACIQGSKEAWDAFVEKYTNLTYHTINKTFKTNTSDFFYQDITDIHNNVFLSLMENDYRKLKQYEGKNGCTVSSWLLVVTRNLALNYIKKLKTYIPLEDDTSDSANVIETVPDPQQQPDEELSKKESWEMLKELIKDLNSKDVLFLKLCYEEELPPEEIAEMLSITVNNVYTRKKRIRENLIKIAKKKDLLQEY
jgi:RNA polymerase sigma factor (sigma-70 family)